MFLNKIKKSVLQKQPIFLLNGEVIWQATDSSLSKEIHGTSDQTECQHLSFHAFMYIIF